MYLNVCGYLVWWGKCCDSDSCNRSKSFNCCSFVRKKLVFHLLNFPSKNTIAFFIYFRSYIINDRTTLCLIFIPIWWISMYFKALLCSISYFSDNMYKIYFKTFCWLALPLLRKDFDLLCHVDLGLWMQKLLCHCCCQWCR